MTKCFAMMPFGGYFDGYWRDTIRPALQSIGLNPVRADEVYGTGAIIEDIYTEILQSDFCLADVTNKNPNVSYELGMAHAANKPTILITQNTSDVPFDYRHLRHIVYNPMESGWQGPFAATLKRTVQEVLNNPGRNLALKADPFAERAKSAEVIRKHLLEIFLAQAQDVDRENRIYLGGEEGCLIVTEWRGYAQSRVHHICHNLVSDLPGKIEVVEAYDVNEARELECVTHEKSQNHLTYFVLFHNLKEAKQRFHIRTKVVAPGYFDLNLLKTSDGALMSTQAVKYGIRYIRKIDRIHFPKKEAFSKVRAKILSHPRPECVDTFVDVEETKDHFVLSLVYDSNEPFQQETGCRVMQS